MHIGSPVYIFSLLLPCLLLFAGWLILRNQSQKVQKIVILSLAALNVFQHLFKSIIYPQHFGQGFTINSTAYNLCACLILLTPIAICVKSKGLKTFCMCAGLCGGLLALVYPVWFLGVEVSELGWEYNRFFICHCVLFLTSGLYLVLGLHKISYLDFWKMGLYLLLVLCVILLNDIICIVGGLFPGWSADKLYKAIASHNPFSLMGPRPGYDSITSVIIALSPSIFTGNNPANTYIPILWYAIPLYLVTSTGTFLAFILVDRKNFAKDLKKLKTKLSKHKSA